MTQINPRTQAVIDAFLDLETPKGLIEQRRLQLRELRPKLYNALEELTQAVYGYTSTQNNGEGGTSSTSGDRA